MCYDLALAARLDAIADAFAEMEVDPGLYRSYESFLHTQAQAHRKHPIVLFEEGYKLKPFEWGVIADYMNTHHTWMKYKIILVLRTGRT